MRRSELPASLGSAFTLAEARDAGVSRPRLRAADLVIAHRGMRARADHRLAVDSKDPPYERLRAALMHRAHLYATVMPDNQFFVAVVAAAAWRVPIPLALLAEDRDLDVGVFAPARHPRRTGVTGHQVQPHLACVTEVEGLRVTDPASTWASMAPVLVSDIELIALGDGFVRERIFRRDREPIATIDDLRAALGRGRRAGIRRLRDLVGLVRTRSASAGETRCRLLTVHAGLAEPLLNYAVRDRLGSLVAVVDLAYAALKIAIEYEGDQHRLDAEQWARDIARHEALIAMGWIVIRVTRAQLYDAPQTVLERIRRAIALRSAVA